MADRCPYGCGAREGFCDCADTVGLVDRVAALEEEIDDMKTTMGLFIEWVGVEAFKKFKEQKR